MALLYNFYFSNKSKSTNSFFFSFLFYMSLKECCHEQYEYNFTYFVGGEITTSRDWQLCYTRFCQWNICEVIHYEQGRPSGSSKKGWLQSLKVLKLKVVMMITVTIMMMIIIVIIEINIKKNVDHRTTSGSHH